MNAEKGGIEKDEPVNSQSPTSNSQRVRLIGSWELEVGRLENQGAAQAQFFASLRSPEPLYFAYCGYGHSGRDRPDCGFEPIICTGVTPCSRHCYIAVSVSNVFGPSPPRQCAMPGTMKSRAKSF